MRFVYGLAILAMILSVAVPRRASDFAISTMDSTQTVVGVGLAACLLSSEEDGPERATHAADAVLVSVGLAQAMKSGMDIRFDSRHNHSFPSGHTAGAFAMAASLSEVYPKKKWAYYAGAAVIGVCAVKSGGHSWGDAIGGAALGIAVGKFSMSHDGILLGKTVRF